MFTSLSIDRFRGFRKLEITGLKPFNLILGRNNVGKTALLEAVFLLLGPTNPELPLTLSALRGIERMRAIPEELWGWLFYGKDINSAIVLGGKLADGNSRKLTISLGESKETRYKNTSSKPLGKRQLATTAATDEPLDLILKYRDEKSKRATVRAFIKENGIGYNRDRSLRFPTSIFISSRVSYAPENAERFSKLEEVGKEEDLIAPLKIIEPRLKRLSMLLTGAGPLIHGDIGIGRLVPLPIMGDGIGRLISLLLAITTSRNGAVLIDEIDTGFHYSSMENVWFAVSILARLYNVQLFATTHNWECLKSAHCSFLRSDTYDFGMLRLDRIDSTLEVFNYGKDKIQTAIDSGMELR